MACELSAWTFAARTRDSQKFAVASRELDSKSCQGSFSKRRYRSADNHSYGRHQKKSNDHEGWNHVSHHSQHVSFYDSRLSRIHATQCVDSVRQLTEANKRHHSQTAARFDPCPWY